MDTLPLIDKYELVFAEGRVCPVQIVWQNILLRVLSANARRLAANADRFRDGCTRYTLRRGRGRIPPEVAPDQRRRSDEITAHLAIKHHSDHGVLIAHGDATSGYSLLVRQRHLVHDMAIRVEVILGNDQNVDCNQAAVVWVARG